jgi:hypothetical protein
VSRFFDELERELTRAAARTSPARAGAGPVPGARRRPPRRLALVLAAAFALAVAGTAAAATYLALRGSSIAPFADRDVTPEQRVAPGTSRVLDLRAADPAAQVPPWALRVARSRSGLLCTTVGQVRGGEFGLVGLDGRFRGLPEANADACSDEGAMLGTRVFAARRFEDVRTVVNGVAGDLDRVTVAVRGGRPRPVPHTAEGAFLAVLRGYPEDAQPVVTLHLRGGRTRRYAFARDDFVVLDPYGERAWRLESSGFGGPREPGDAPGMHPSCVHFAKARAVPGEPYVTSPAVCGMAPVRPGVRQDTLFFDTRRLRGDREPGGAVMLDGDWNGHPPRVAVYGSARGHRRIVVRAPGVRVETEPKPNGGFLVFLPPATRPAGVTVEVDGRRYGSSFGTIDPEEAG